MEHPLDIINERFMDGYYDNLPPYSYGKDAATVGYLMGYVSKIDWELAKFKYEFNNKNINYDKRRLCIL